MRQFVFFARSLQLLGLCAGLIHAVLPDRCEAGEWSLPDSRMGIRTAPLLLLTRPDVQADVGLEPSQADALHKTINELSQRAQALRGKTGGEVVAERRAIDDAQAQWLTTNLSEQQLRRLSQIDLQWEGSSALVSRPSVADMLKLNVRQVRAAHEPDRRTQRTSHQKRLQPGRGDGGPSEDARHPVEPATSGLEWDSRRALSVQGRPALRTRRRPGRQASGPCRASLRGHPKATSNVRFLWCGRPACRPDRPADFPLKSCSPQRCAGVTPAPQMVFGAVPRQRFMIATALPKWSIQADRNVGSRSWMAPKRTILPARRTRRAGRRFVGTGSRSTARLASRSGCARARFEG